MFTGIIEEVGKVTSIREERGTRRLTVAASQLIKELKKGDSIAVSGVCLTAVGLSPNAVAFDLAEETWNRTSFSRIDEGALVNLEVDMIAKYVEKMMKGESANSSVTLERLVEQGF